MSRIYTVKLWFNESHGHELDNVSEDNLASIKEEIQNSEWIEFDGFMVNTKLVRFMRWSEQ